MKSEGSVSGEKNPSHSRISQSTSQPASWRAEVTEEPQTFISIRIRRGFVLPGAESHARFSTFAERLVFVFFFIILSRMRYQMEEAGGAL